ncbi:MAG TPA: outer membrane beta-barrel protein [Gammaproteobacteria bacterium]|nr:outer membrane beta-barrel protein [Gammaproteobacteria bacterium]
MNMKLAGIALSGAMLLSGASFGMDFDPKFYLGAEVQANRYKGAKEVKTTQFGTFEKVNNKPLFGKSGSGVSAFLGSQFIEYAGIELGYTALSGGKLSIKDPGFQNSSLKTKSRNMYADVLGYVPVCEDMDLIGSLGIGRLSSTVKGKIIGPNNARVVATENVSLKSSKTGLRLGLGAQYKVTPNVGARFMVRHQKGNKFVKSVNSAGLGLFYQF